MARQMYDRIRIVFYSFWLYCRYTVQGDSYLFQHFKSQLEELVAEYVEAENLGLLKPRTALSEFHMRHAKLKNAEIYSLMWRIQGPGQNWFENEVVVGAAHPGTALPRMIATLVRALNENFNSKYMLMRVDPSTKVVSIRTTYVSDRHLTINPKSLDLFRIMPEGGVQWML